MTKQKATDKTFTFYIHNNIGHGGTLAKPFIEWLKDIEPTTVNVHIDSSGGDIFEGIAIYEAVKNYNGKTRAYINGKAFGIASIIACACDEIHMKKGSYFVLSEPKMHTTGSARGGIMLDKIRSILAEIWMEKSKKTQAEIFKMMELETWLTDSGALSGGFVDYVYE